MDLPYPSNIDTKLADRINSIDEQASRITISIKSI